MELIELIQFIELVDIIVHEERARKIIHEATNQQLTTEPLIETRLGIRNEVQQFGVRFRLLFTGQNEEYVADFEAIYSIDEKVQSELSETLLLEFSEEVGYLAIYPYLRASIFGSASRLGMPRPVLGIARRGDFQASEQMNESQAKATFFDNVPEIRSK